jgi:serine/threonine protein kinase
LNHPLIIGFENHISATECQPAAIVSEFVPNGSLADHLSELNKLSKGTRIAMIATGIVLAMRYLPSQCIIHRDLTPANVWIDGKWIVRICDFNSSLSANASVLAFHEEMFIFSSMQTSEVRYIAPECLENAPNLKSDVF